MELTLPIGDIRIYGSFSLKFHLLNKNRAHIHLFYKGLVLIAPFCLKNLVFLMLTIASDEDGDEDDDMMINTWLLKYF